MGNTMGCNTDLVLGGVCGPNNKPLVIDGVPISVMTKKERDFSLGDFSLVDTYFKYKRSDLALMQLKHDLNDINFIRRFEQLSLRGHNNEVIREHRCGTRYENKYKTLIFSILLSDSGKFVFSKGVAYLIETRSKIGIDCRLKIAEGLYREAPILLQLAVWKSECTLQFETESKKTNTVETATTMGSPTFIEEDKERDGWKKYKNITVRQNGALIVSLVKPFLIEEESTFHASWWSNGHSKQHVTGLRGFRIVGDTDLPMREDFHKTFFERYKGRLKGVGANILPPLTVGFYLLYWDEQSAKKAEQTRKELLQK